MTRSPEPVMINLSVNVNKVATVRNSRGGREPSVVEAVRVCVDAGAPGITVSPWTGAPLALNTVTVNGVVGVDKIGAD